MAKSKYKKYDILLIRWDDACGAAGWNRDEKALMEAHLVNTVGFFLDETPERLLVCANHAYTVGNNGDYMSIPKDGISKVTILKRVKYGRS